MVQNTLCAEEPVRVYKLVITFTLLNSLKEASSTWWILLKCLTSGHASDHPFPQLELMGHGSHYLWT